MKSSSSVFMVQEQVCNSHTNTQIQEKFVVLTSSVPMSRMGSLSHFICKPLHPLIPNPLCLMRMFTSSPGNQWCFLLSGFFIVGRCQLRSIHVFHTCLPWGFKRTAGVSEWPSVLFLHLLGCVCVGGGRVWRGRIGKGIESLKAAEMLSWWALLSV